MNRNPPYLPVVAMVLTSLLLACHSGPAAAAVPPPPGVWGPVANLDLGAPVNDVVGLEAGLVVVAGGEAGLQLVDLSEPSWPRALPNGSGHAAPRSLYLAPEGGSGSLGRLHVALGYMGVGFLELGPTEGLSGDLLPPVETDTPGFAEQLVAVGPYLYVADGLAGLSVLQDLDGHYVVVDTYDTPGYAQALEVHDHIAYVADGESGLVIVDLSDPANATHMGSCGAIGTCGDPTQFKDLTIRGTIAYIVDGDGSLQLFDVFDQSQPRLLDGVDMSGVADSILLVAERAYITTDTGLWEVDVSDPEDIFTVSHSRLPGQPRGLARLDEQHLLVAAGEAGLLVLERMRDSDGDGVGDPLDAYPRHPWYAADSDMDGHPDAVVEGARPRTGDPGRPYLELDAFPQDRSASRDSDGDGYPDAYNYQGLRSGLRLDAFPRDPAASRDSDGDGYPDEWNPGYSRHDSTTGLELDVAPHNANFATTTDLIALFTLFAALGLLALAVRGYAGGRRGA